MENTPYYDPRVVIYERKMFIGFATVKDITVGGVGVKAGLWRHENAYDLTSTFLAIDLSLVTLEPLWNYV